jgi:hypothetical protein
MVGVLREDGRPCGRMQLLIVDTEAGQVGPDQDAPQGRGTPAATSCGRDTTGVQLATQRGEGFTGKSPAGQLLDQSRLVGLNGAEVTSVAAAAWAAVRAAPFGQLLLLAADPPEDVVGLLGVDGGQDAGAEQVIGVADVDLARDSGAVPGPGAVADHPASSVWPAQGSSIQRFMPTCRRKISAPRLRGQGRDRPPPPRPGPGRRPRRHRRGPQPLEAARGGADRGRRPGRGRPGGPTGRRSARTSDAASWSPAPTSPT